MLLVNRYSPAAMCWFELNVRSVPVRSATCRERARKCVSVLRRAPERKAQFDQFGVSPVVNPPVLLHRRAIQRQSKAYHRHCTAVPCQGNAVRDGSITMSPHALAGLPKRWSALATDETRKHALGGFSGCPSGQRGWKTPSLTPALSPSNGGIFVE